MSTAAFPLKQFLDQLPKELVEFIELLKVFNLSVNIVGGVVRDYYLTQKISPDFDLEILPTQQCEHHKCELIYQDLANYLTRNNYSFERHAFGVFKLELETLELELIPARKEIYFEGRLEHKNFRVEFLDISRQKEAFLRRDFTINALAISFSKNKIDFLDFFAGIHDLNGKLLRHCSDSFDQDPVRKLRASRFKSTLGFSWTKELEQLLSRMSLDKISAHYFLYEWKKCSYSADFMTHLLQTEKKEESFIVDLLHELKQLRSTQLMTSLLNHSSLKILEVLFLSSSALATSEAIPFFFSLPLKKWRRFSHFFKVFKESDFELNKLKNLVEQNSFQKLQNNDLFLNLFYLYSSFSSLPWDYQQSFSFHDYLKKAIAKEKHFLIELLFKIHRNNNDYSIESIKAEERKNYLFYKKLQALL